MALLPEIRVVLVGTRGPVNLGAVARLAANFDAELALVRPEASPDDPEAELFATDGLARLRAAPIHPEAASAVGEADLVVATSSRRGRTREGSWSPDRLVREVRARACRRLAIIFGPEDHGLGNAEIDLAAATVAIPAPGDSPVLNLSHSVAVLLARLREPSEDPPPESAGAEPPAPSADIEAMFGHLRNALLEIGFLDGGNPVHIERDLRRMLSAGPLSPRDVAIWRGIARQVIWASRNRR